jgi:hypothetical protein
MSFETKDYESESGNPHIRTHRRVYVGSAAARYLERGYSNRSPHQNDWRRAVARAPVSRRDPELEQWQTELNRNRRAAESKDAFVSRIPIRRVRKPEAYSRRYTVYPRSVYAQYWNPRPAARHTVRGRSSVSDRADFDIGSVAPPAARRRRVPIARGAYYTQQNRRRRWW